MPSRRRATTVSISPRSCARASSGCGAAASTSRRGVRTPKLSVPSASSTPRASARRSATGRRASAIVRPEVRHRGRPAAAGDGAGKGAERILGHARSRQELRQRLLLEAGQAADDAVDDERVATVTAPAAAPPARPATASGNAAIDSASCQRTRGARSPDSAADRRLHRIAVLAPATARRRAPPPPALPARCRRSARSTVAASSAPSPSSVHERVQPRPRIAGAGGQRGQRRRDRAIAALDEQPLRGVAPPAVRMLEHRDQIGRRLRRERRTRPASRRLVHDAIDAPEPGRLDQAAGADLVLQVLRLVLPVLDHAAVHVGDVERAVRRRQQVHRPEPLVGRGEELAARMRVGRGEPAVGAFLQGVASHQVAGGLGDEHVPRTSAGSRSPR